MAAPAVVHQDCQEALVSGTGRPRDLDVMRPVGYPDLGRPALAAMEDAVLAVRQGMGENLIAVEAVDAADAVMSDDGHDKISSCSRAQVTGVGWARKVAEWPAGLQSPRGKGIGTAWPLTRLMKAPACPMDPRPRRSNSSASAWLASTRLTNRD